MPFATAAGGSVHYEVEGRGPGLVLVHGAGGDADRTFGSFLPHVAGSRTVVRPNLSGSGKTTDTGGELTLELLSDQVIAAAADAVEGPVDLLGFSLGAVVAAVTAARSPLLVRRLVLVAGVAHTTGPYEGFNFAFWRDLLATDLGLFKRFAMLQGFSPAMLEAFGHEGLDAALAEQWPSGVGRQVALSAEVDIRDLLRRIQAPTLVIGHTGDMAMPIAGSRLLHEGIPDSRLVELEGGGHMDWLVQPDRIAELTREFIKA